MLNPYYCFMVVVCYKYTILLQALQKDIKEKLTDELDTLFEQFITDVEQYERLEEQNQNYVFKRSISTRY